MLRAARALFLVAAASRVLAAQGQPSLPPPLQQPVPKASRSEKAPAAPAKPLPPEAVLVELSGVLKDVDRRENRMTVETASGPVTLGFDRNTMVYTATGLGTVRDLVAGVQLRAGRNVAMRAYWVQVRPPSPPGSPASTPGQGTGPGGGTVAPPAERGGGAGTPPGPGAPGPGSEAPGTTPPARERH